MQRTARHFCCGFDTWLRHSIMVSPQSVRQRFKTVRRYCATRIAKRFQSMTLRGSNVTDCQGFQRCQPFER